jgi:hypothetical protein
MTIDAFASEATAVLPRYWTEQPSANSEGVDALRQEWPLGELVWAHPPTDKLAALVKHLKLPERESEVVVCAPYWKSAPWFLDLVQLADEKVKYRAGKLSRVAQDAPDRLEGWPLMIFHVPARPSKPRGGKKLPEGVLDHEPDAAAAAAAAAATAAAAGEAEDGAAGDEDPVGEVPVPVLPAA